MKTEFKTKKVVLIILILLMIFVLYKTTFKPIERLTDVDKEEIMKITNQYYDNLINQNYELALMNCYLEDNKIDFEVRVAALEQIRKNIIDEIRVDYRPNDVVLYEDDRCYTVVYNLYLKYKNTTGGAISEVVYVKKINGNWKITKIWGLDIYGYYRVNEYRCDRLLSFLN